MNDIQGLDILLQKLGGLGGNIDSSTVRAIGKATLQTQAIAKANVVADTGELRRAIKTIVKQMDGSVEGTVYTNASHAPYVEFGTGPVGQRNKPPLPSGVNVSYRQDAWWIHESQIDKETAEKYNFFRIETKDGIFYKCEGQAAQPFMMPASRYAEKNAEKIIKDDLKQEIGRLEQ